MVGSDRKLEGAFWVVIALIMIVVLIAVQACSLFDTSSEETESPRRAGDAAGAEAGMDQRHQAGIYHAGTNPDFNRF